MEISLCGRSSVYYSFILKLHFVSLEECCLFFFWLNFVKLMHIILPLLDIFQILLILFLKYNVCGKIKVLRTSHLLMPYNEITVHCKP